MRRLILATVLPLAACTGATVVESDLARVGSGTGGAESDSSSTGSAANTTATSTVLPQCTWASDLNPPDAGTPSWGVGRTYLSCQDGDGVELCLSDNLTACPGPNLVAGATLGPCVDVCNLDEYAVYSGGPPIPEPDGGFGSFPQPPLPASCKGVAFNPGGWQTSCCPCQ